MNKQKVVTLQAIYDSLIVLKAAFPEKSNEYDTLMLEGLCVGFDISIMKLPRSIECVLRRHGITTVTKLRHRTNNDLLRLNGIWKKRLEVIKQRKEEFFFTE
jgi:DNA-directed RNA polymerase alpha subunit